MSGIESQEPEDFPATGKVRLLRRRVRPRVPLRNRVPSEKLRRGVYLIPSLFTAGNIMCGFFSIVSTFNGEYVQAALFVIFAHVLDGVDGYAARLTKTTSQFGIEFDSLADVVSFGVAPAILVYFGHWCRGAIGVGWRRVPMSCVGRSGCLGSMCRPGTFPKAILSGCPSLWRPR